MFDIFKGSPLRIIELSDTIKVETNITDTYLPALRAGFVGCPINPRWGAMKFHAWKVGRQWRLALAKGELAIRTSDSMLVESGEEEQIEAEEKASPKRSWRETVQKFASRTMGRDRPFTLPSA